MPITQVRLSTEKYFTETMQEEQTKSRRARNKKALADLALGLFGAAAIMGMAYAVEQIEVWWPAVQQLLRALGA